MKFSTAIFLSLFATALLLAYTDSRKFGSLPHGKRLRKIKRSPNYRDGKFQNIQPITSGGLGDVLRSLFALIGKLKIEGPCIPSVKTDLSQLDIADDVLFWFGHSSYFIQIAGKRVIVDPLFSEISSPIPNIPKAFPGSNAYGPEDIPEVDYLLITHDHWDHLDYETVRSIKFRSVICPLGVGAHLERFGVSAEIVMEMDWNGSIEIGKNFKIYCLPARHFAGRWLRRNKSLWASFLIETGDNFKIFIGGDSGYGTHFAEIGKKFGGIDLAILENGQYNENWKQIHMYPEETIRAAEDLMAKALLPVHMAKIYLSVHPWDEPLEKITELAKDKNFRVLTPLIGQRVSLKDQAQIFQKWWKRPA
ncbi:MAG: MBL fold metallo-hydrolase [Puniceicoccales bacterium]|jgi:L-ascorbate metabolism protein UlaG (beta-lactamase superfamily)|nr:MBL fold metallo-hydrolase [Puniceicoccales bacterium]